MAAQGNSSFLALHERCLGVVTQRSPPELLALAAGRPAAPGTAQRTATRDRHHCPSPAGRLPIGNLADAGVGPTHSAHWGDTSADQGVLFSFPDGDGGLLQPLCSGLAAETVPPFC